MHHHDNPAARVLAHYQNFQACLEAGGKRGRAGISVDIVGFRRYQGDWVGAVVTPWFIHLLLLPGGGELWCELAAGETLRVAFPAGDLEFVMEHSADAALPAHAFATILAPLDALADQNAALASAVQALQLIFDPGCVPAPAAAAPDVKAAENTAAGIDRRGFFRRLAGRRGLG